jgi:hypothetical protein
MGYEWVANGVLGRCAASIISLMPASSSACLPPCCPAPLQTIEQAGFKGVDYENLTFGVVAIHSGFKLA